MRNYLFFLIPLFMGHIACIDEGTYDGIVVVTESKKGGDQFLHIDWSKFPNEANLNWYRVNRSINDQSFQTISTMDLENGDQVKVLNVYPVGSVSKNAKFELRNGTVLDTNYASAGLKVYMEGGKVTLGTTKTEDVQAAGELDVDGTPRQLISVTPMDFTTYTKNTSCIFDYDVVMFGSWDDFAHSSRIKANPSDDAMDKIQKYVDQGFGLLIGHDGISALMGKESGFGKLASQLGIEIGYMKPDSGSPSNVVHDHEINFEIKTEYVKVTREGRLTTYPWNLGKLGTVMTIPTSHTASQFAHEDIWFEFADDVQGNLDPNSCTKCTSTTNHDLTTASQKGNCIFYLTTKANMAFIQTGHSSGKSSPDERKILANTLFYLKQKSNNKYVNDFDVFDVEPPLAPVHIETKKSPNSPSSNTEAGKTLIKVGGTDIGTKFVYNIVGYNPVMAQIYKSGNITAVVTAGMKSFIYAFDQDSTCSFDALTKSVDATEVAAASVPSSLLLSKLTAIKVSDIVTKNVKYGEATIEVDDHPEETYYLHVASVDNKDWKSKTITNIKITFPKLPTPAQTPTQSAIPPPPTQSAVPPSPAPTQKPEQTQVPKTPEPAETEKTTEEKQDPDSNNQNKGEGGKKDSNTSTIIGVVVGAVAAAAAVAGVVAAVTMCRPPIAIIPFFGSEEEEEEEEDFVELPANVIFQDEQLDPNIQSVNDDAVLEAYENDV